MCPRLYVQGEAIRLLAGRSARQRRASACPGGYAALRNLLPRRQNSFENSLNHGGALTDRCRREHPAAYEHQGSGGDKPSSIAT